MEASDFSDPKQTSLEQRLISTSVVKGLLLCVGVLQTFKSNVELPT